MVEPGVGFPESALKGLGRRRGQEKAWEKGPEHHGLEDLETGEPYTCSGD